ncbi:MAG TPA: FG-GAP-like repeat-containing protein [Phycisphaerales bacterium]|nr:FG-GAP-like repeat-containing protein [Phycisphaerales bacterium]HMP36976.1 FG-GAP-like repeat-containing protein [Phycisphaerales bacterium]
MRLASVLTAATAVGVCAPMALGQWVAYQNETASRLVAPPNLVVNDNIEKDFAYGDFNKNGWVDLVVVRKFPGSIQGGFRNLLLMNEGGVLVDRTDEYAVASDIEGYFGFLDPTNDRDVKAVDVDGDGWLDLITCTTMSDQVNWILGQPRVYMNLGNDANGNWLGFRFEHQRLPQMFSKTGAVANPRFCEMAVADFTGDGYPDIFFVDYDTPETSGTVCIDLNGNGSTADPGECQQSPPQNPNLDFDNKFVVNHGAANPGYFFDSTNTRFTTSQLASAFGNAALAADLSGNGWDEVVRVNTLTGGQNVAVYRRNQLEGMSWTGPNNIYTGLAPYNIVAGDLNNDGRIDLVVVDDSKDRFMINNTTAANGFATFTTFTINDSLNEFGNQAVLADLDNDGFLDLMIADVDADLPPFCPTTGRRAHIYRNTFPTNGINGNMLDEIGQIIPNNMLTATYDFAPIDLNNDGWLDLVIGRCAGIQVWMNIPPVSLSFTYPDGLPGLVDPGVPTDIQVTANIVGGGSIVPGTGLIYVSVDGGPFASSPMTDLGGNQFVATLPAIECGSSVAYYFSGDLSNGPVVNDPPTAPLSAYVTSAFDSVEEIFFDGAESGLGGWTVADTAVTFGSWIAAAPVGTVLSGNQAAPNVAFEGTQAFLTGVGVPGGTAGASDLDGGPTILTSPLFDIDGDDAIVSYARWFFCDDVGIFGADELRVEVSNNNGANWTVVETTTTNAGQWVVSDFRVSNFVEPSDQMRVRFWVSDNPNNSVTEAGIDAFRIEAYVCDDDPKPTCLADLNSDGVVDGADLGILLGAWGGADADLNGDGSTDGADLGILLGAWGNCP